MAVPYLDPLPDHEGTRDELIRADELAKHAPADLSDRHIRILACYDQSLARRAFDSRAKALSVQTPKALKSPSATPGADWKMTEPQFQSMLDAYTRAFNGEDETAWDDFVAAHQRWSVPLAIVDALCLKGLFTIAAKSRERGARLEALETDPFKLIDAIEREQDRTDDPYWKWVESLMASAVATRELLDIDEAEDVRHLRETRGGGGLETAARRVGFVVGFEYAARLLTGRGDKLPGGAR